ncbi:MAG: DUF3540 domain-containing protein [Kiritimatiellae bacterium]|nr:DUF3540 domain-containing protein [Kiritimatiellia bacterium]
MQDWTGNDIAISCDTYLGPAEVLGFYDQGRLLRIRPVAWNRQGDVWAQVAIPGAPSLRAGSMVLAIGGKDAEFYVIGLLDESQKRGGVSDAIEFEGGVRAVRAGAAGEELHVCAESGDLLFSYDVRAGRIEVDAPAGDVRIAGKQGAMKLVTEGDMVFESGGEVRVHAARGIRLTVQNVLRELRTSLGLGSHRMDLHAQNLDVAARTGSMKIQDAAYAGEKVEMRVKRSRVIADQIESCANDIVETAKNVFRRVTELSQVQCGRMKTIVQSTFRLKSRRAVIKAEKDVKIDGKSINLG